MTMPTGEAVAAVLELHAEVTVLVDQLAGAADDVAAVLNDHRLRLRLAEHAVRLAAIADPGRFLEELERSEMLAWIHDPTLYRRALSESGPADARRLLNATVPAARLYAAVAHEAAGERVPS